MSPHNPDIDHTEDENQQEEDMLLESLHTRADEDETPGNEISYEPQELLSFAQIEELDKKYLLQNYQRMPVSFAYGSGEFLYDNQGAEYIDFLSGIAVTGMGHAHADLVAALTFQADNLWHSSNLFYNQQQAMLARALVEINFPGKVFFANSGTEANEAAIKLMRAHGQKKNIPAEKIVSLKGSFHGRTFGAMSITGQDKVHGGFGSLMPNVVFVEPNDIAGLEQAIDEDTCGVIMEPIMGEGGIIPLTDEFLQAARELTRSVDALLVFDEIQTGMGRTGEYFAYQHSGVIPDALTMAKGLGGGIPIGAMLVAEKYTDVLAAGSHGSTFGGNHLATAVGYEVIRLMEAGKVLENVQGMSEYLVGHLENLKRGYPGKVKDIRGRGLLLGLVLREDIQARPLVKAALDKKLVIGRAGDNVLRLAPPLILRQSTADRALAKIEELIAEI